MDIQIFDCAVGDTLHIGKYIKLVIIDAAASSDSFDAPTVTLQIDAANFILVEDKLVDEKYEVYS